jgi:hypothetical protein
MSSTRRAQTLVQAARPFNRLVMANTFIPNPNVFYELGVRHGTCPRGVLAVRDNFVSE